MLQLRFRNLVAEDKLNLHLLNQLSFPEKETQSERKLIQPDTVTNITTTILGKNTFIRIANKLVAMD